MITDEFEFLDLAQAVLGIADTADDTAIDEALWERFEVDLMTFSEIAAALLPFTVPAKTVILEKWYQGFVKDGAFLYKREVTKPLT
jgi:hypothetical protein